MGHYMGMGENMGNVELDDRGRLTLPAKIRETLHINPGDKLNIKVDKDKKIILQKKINKEELFSDLVGCIKTPLEENPTPESIKKIWKTNQ